MDRINGANTVDIGGGKRGFRNVDLAVGVVGTEVTADFLNGVQEELLNIIAGLGVGPTNADRAQLGKAIQSGILTFAVAGGTANALTAALYIAPPTNFVGMTVRLKITAENTGPVTLNVGPGALPVVTQKGAALKRGDLPANSFLCAVCTGTAWQVQGAVYSEVPQIVSGNLTFYVRSDGNDNNDGSANTAAAAFLTPQGAVDYIARTYAANAFMATINIAAGNYGTLLVAQAPMRLAFVGDVATPANVTLGSGAAANGIAVNIGGSSNVTFAGVRISNSATAGIGLLAGSNANVGIQNCDLNFANSHNLQIQTGANVVLGGAINLVGGNHLAFANISTGGLLSSSSTSPPVITVVATMNYTTAWALVSTGGVFDAASMTFVNKANAIGSRYQSVNGGNILTNGGGASFLPGTTAGTVANGGIYA